VKDNISERSCIELSNIAQTIMSLQSKMKISPCLKEGLHMAPTSEDERWRSIAAQAITTSIGARPS
jgi:hypothetical protein